MRRYMINILLSTFIAITLILPSSFLTVARAQSVPETALTGEYLPDRLLIKFNPGARGSDIAALHSQAGTKVRRNIDQIGAQELEVPAQQLERAYARLVNNPNVEYVLPDYVVRPTFVPNDPYFASGTQWAPQKIQAPAAWDLATGSGVTIAVIDSGIDPNHPDLRDRLVPGYNFFDGSYDTSDGCGHGTHVAGIAAATGNNSEGITGIAFNSRLMPIKAINNYCSGSVGSIILGITYAVDQGARVIVISSGTTSPHNALLDAINYARSRGVIVVAASGNSNTDVPFYPASYPEAFAVAGTDANDNRYGASNFGSQIDVAAPATPIYSTYWSGSTGSTYANMGGTSMAAPHVAGVAALVLSINPGLSASQLEDLLKANADDLGAIGWDPYFGSGRVNAWRAVSAVQSNEPTVHVDNLAGSSTTVSKKAWKASVKVTIRDNQGNIVSGADVTGAWASGYAGTAQCITGSDGSCAVSTGNIDTSITAVEFSIQTLAHSALTYDAVDNKSSLIAVTKPGSTSNTKGGGRNKNAETTELSESPDGAGNPVVASTVVFLPLIGK